ncbi:hypothetical protein CALCODRAFT_488816 [Calocera cornea HHB12733]|uniref:Uncharacterized protein n=1 Tax=Calocera cornea HHB12733 TaxID=1353952 RepID=A0A165C640_9BASI|nr:hypothetical protein CALCODRAFT_488816 [Calocera cornea HHB12733]
MSTSTSRTTQQPPHPERSSSLFSGITAAASKPLTWFAERKERHERLEAARNSGIPSWGWSPESKPREISRTVSEPAVPIAKEEQNPETAAQKHRRDKEWAQVGGLFEGLGESHGSPRTSEDGLISPGIPDARPASAPSTAPLQDLEAQKKAQREELERYSIMESI